MNPEKQHRKLHSLSVEADQCTTRGGSTRDHS